jgi:outer membrane protein OmpA-like peptidoglycan-associated protein
VARVAHCRFLKAAARREPDRRTLEKRAAANSLGQSVVLAINVVTRQSGSNTSAPIDLCRSFANPERLRGARGEFFGNAVMLMGKSPSACSVDERKTSRPACRLAIMAVLLGLAACNPVETWRDMTGASRNDPDPETTPNTRNLAAGEAADYPNLATVPPPPIRAMTAAERDKLTQSLIADRANARHTDEQLRAGFAAAPAAPPPPPPPSPTPATEPGDAQSGSVAAPPPASTVPSSGAPAPYSIIPTPEGAAGGNPAVPGPGPSAAAKPSTAAGAAGEQLAAPPPGTRVARAGGKTPAEGPGQGLRKQGEPPEPAPMESTLEVPQARTTPQPEQIQPAPPAPLLPPTPRVASTGNPLPGGLAAGGALAPPPSPEAKGSAGFEPPPTAPELPPLPPTRSAAAGPGKGGPKSPAPVGKPIAEIKFRADSTSLTDRDRKTLETVVPLYQENPGKVRIVGYAGPEGGAVEQLNSFRAALDRAQAVAAALTDAGIPSDKIQVEAAPAGANSGESRAEVLLEH